jgi:hypothetical protein
VETLEDFFFFFRDAFFHDDSFLFFYYNFIVLFISNIYSSFIFITELTAASDFSKNFKEFLSHIFTFFGFLPLEVTKGPKPEVEMTYFGELKAIDVVRNFPPSILTFIFAFIRFGSKIYFDHYIDYEFL